MAKDTSTVKAPRKPRKKAVAAVEAPVEEPRPTLPDGWPTAEQMEAYINAVGIPTEPVRIAPGSVVVEPAKFVATHLLNITNEAMPRHNRGLFYYRLLAFCKELGRIL